jgi:hypothetical protein
VQTAFLSSLDLDGISIKNPHPLTRNSLILDRFADPQVKALERLRNAVRVYLEAGRTFAISA